MKTTTAKPRALVYCRVSTTGQEEKGTSLESQAAACTEFARAKGYQIAETVKEVFSGAYLFDRPKLNECRARLRTGAYNAVVVYAIDRLSRDVAHLAIIADEIERAGAELYFVTEDLDKTAEGKLMLSVKSYVGEVERLKIRERSMRGKRTKAQSGKLFAPSCELFGYVVNRETGKREIVESEAAIVRRVFQEYAAGQSIRGICIRFNDEGIASPGATKKNYQDADTYRNLSEFGRTIWGSGAIYRILKNPAYVGKSYALRYQSETGYANGARFNKLKLKPQSEWVELPDDVTPAIVTPELFEAAHARLNVNKGDNKRNEQRPSLLRGLVYCRCGRKMHPAWSNPSPKRSRPGYLYYNFRCAASADGVRCIEPGKQVNGTKLEAMIWEKVKDVLSNPESIRLELEQRQEVNQCEREELQKDINSIQTTLNKITGELNRLVERMASVDDAVFDIVQKQIASKTKERARLESILSEANARLKSFDSEVSGLATLELYCDTFNECLGSIGFSDKRLICEALGVKVVGNKDNESLSLAIPTNPELLEDFAKFRFNDKYSWNETTLTKSNEYSFIAFTFGLPKSRMAVAVR